MRNVVGSVELLARSRSCSRPRALTKGDCLSSEILSRVANPLSNNAPDRRKEALARSTRVVLAGYTLATAVLDVIAIVVAMALAVAARDVIELGQLLSPEEIHIGPAVYLIAIGVWLATSGALGLYRVERNISPLRQCAHATAALLVFCALFAGALFFTFREVSRLLFGYFFLLCGLGLVGLRLALPLILRWALPLEQRIAVVGTGPLARIVAQSERSAPLGIPRSRMVGFIRVLESLDADTMEPGCILGEADELAGLIARHDIDEVIIALPPDSHQSTRALVPAILELGVGVRIVPDVIELAATQARLETLDAIPVIRLRDRPINAFEQVEKRLFDVILSTILLFLLSPLLLVIALAIRLDSPGPVLYRARRVGQGGRPFTMYKFRSMIMDAEAQLPAVSENSPPGRSIYKAPGDPRVTRVGRVLRRTSLDELPQLVNVLRGDMSLVGPRPEQPFIVKDYRPWQRRRFDVTPGITGWWQINGRELPMNLHTEYDLYYLHNYSPGLDLTILAKTIWAVIKGRGAY